MNRGARLSGVGLAAWLLGGVLPTLQAQWMSQTLELRAGWNAVFLEVQPEPPECDRVLAGLPVESVWRWNRRFSPVQFIDDPADLVPPRPDWLVYLPPTHPLAQRTSLYSLDGGRAYLIKLRDDAPATTWIVRGKALLHRPEWRSDSLNYVGFNMPRGVTPSFENFFAGASTLRQGPVFRLDETGRWREAALTEGMRPGEGFWVRTLGPTVFTGPLQVEVEQANDLEYGRQLREQTLTIRNVSGAPLTVTVRSVESEVAATEQEPSVAGPVPLSYWQDDAPPGPSAWAPLTDAIDRELLANAEWTLRLAVRRPAMAAPSGAAGPAGWLYQSILEVSDDGGLTRVAVPVTAQGVANDVVGSSIPVKARRLKADPFPRAGLWVGSVVLDGVSQPMGSDPLEVLPAGSEFQFRLLLHLDRDGSLKLLQRILQMWKPGTYRPDPDNPGLQLVDVPGRYVLLTDESLIPQYAGAALRDGTPVGRRFSTAAFGFRDPIPMTSDGPGRWACLVPLGYDDPVNPFKHRAHPDHDNLDARYETALPAGREAFTVTRRIELEFTPDDPDGLALAGWGDNQVGGRYRETISGLITGPGGEPLYLRGSFRLYLASSIDALNEED